MGRGMAPADGNTDGITKQMPRYLMLGEFVPRRLELHKRHVANLLAKAAEKVWWASAKTAR